MSEGTPPVEPTPTEPTSPPPAAPSGLSVPDGPNSGGSWRDALPDDIREHPDVTRYKSVSELAKGVVNANALIGRKGVILPNESDPADVERFYTELGRPETAEGYDLGEFAPPEGLGWDSTMQSGFLEQAHKLGASNAQAAGMLNWYAEAAAASAAEMQQQADAAVATNDANLRRELGAAYDAKMNLASRAVTQFAGESAGDLLGARLSDGSELGNHPGFIRMMISAAENLGEDVLESDATMRLAAQHTPASAQAEIKALMADDSFREKWLDAHNPGHAEALAQMDRLYKLAKPE